MRFPLAFALPLALTCLSLGSQVPKEWKLTYDKLSKTIVDNDIKAYMTWMDPSFTNIQEGRKTHFHEYEKIFTEFMKPFSHIKATATPLTFKRSRKNVTIDFHYTFSGDYTAKGEKKTLRFFEDGTDTWRKSHGKYLEVVEVVKKQGLLPTDSKGASG